MSINNKWIKAEEGLDNSVIYIDEEGNKLIRHWKSFEDQPISEASTRSWRNNNPGNHIMGPFARKNGAIGSAGKIPTKGNKELKFAVFPDSTTGRKVQALRLKEGDMYIDLTLNEFVRKYTGVKTRDPDTEEVINYRKAIKFFTKFDMDRTIRSLNEEEYALLLDAMKKHEGWREGREEYIECKKILGVDTKNNGSITAFLVGTPESHIWISKNEAIALAERGALQAIVIHCTNFTYLRPKHGKTPFRKLLRSTQTI